MDLEQEVFMILWGHQDGWNLWNFKLFIEDDEYGEMLAQAHLATIQQYKSIYTKILPPNFMDHALLVRQSFISIKRRLPEALISPSKYIRIIATSNLEL